jgi:hypothetical protein
MYLLFLLIIFLWEMRFRVNYICYVIAINCLVIFICFLVAAFLVVNFILAVRGSLFFISIFLIFISYFLGITIVY